MNELYISFNMENNEFECDTFNKDLIYALKTWHYNKVNPRKILYSNQLLENIIKIYMWENILIVPFDGLIKQQGTNSFFNNNGTCKITVNHTDIESIFFLSKAWDVTTKNYTGEIFKKKHINLFEFNFIKAFKL